MEHILAKQNDPTKPSASNRNNREEDQEFENFDDQQLNDALHNYAQKHNLTAQKVKTIIYHIMKNPNTFATLIRKNPDVMAGLRMTRSRLHQLEHIVKRSIPAPELKPINAPRTFLDVNYGEEDEEDADYSPGKEMEEEDKNDDEEMSSSDRFSSNDNEEEDENELKTDDGTKTTDSSDNPEDGKRNEQIALMEENTVQPDGFVANEEEHEFLTKVDNPIYPLFIRSIMGAEDELDPLTREQLYNEDDDPEYMFQEFDGFYAEEDEYEFRQDRATEIPRWELKALEQDFVIPIGDASSNILDVPMESRPQSKLEKSGTIPIEIISKCFGLQHTPPSVSNCRNDQQAESNQQNFITSDGSYTLLAPKNQIKFTSEEVKALKIQLEKHVQLLCQCIVGSSPYPELIETRNTAVQMLTDLSDASESRIHQAHSLFHIFNLLPAVYSAHDIEACKQVDLPLKMHNETHPSKETMWVLARSQACRYPELLPRHSFIFSSPNLPFLPSEQLLLAMALYQLHHVPHNNQKGRSTRPQRGKYPLITEYFLPGRTLNQMKCHLRNIRCSPSPTLLQRIIGQAERGIFDVKYKPDLGETARDDIPLNWPSELQPFWLKTMADCFRRAQVEVSAVAQQANKEDGDVQLDLDFVVQQITKDVNRKNGKEDGTTMTMTQRDSTNTKRTAGNVANDKKLRRGKKDSSMRMKEAIANFGSGTITSGQDETSNDQFPAITASHMMENSQQNSVGLATTLMEIVEVQPQPFQKKSRRKLRAARGMAALQKEETRDATMRSLVEAVYLDFKQRMFMHQDKFRAIQTILINPHLTTAEKFSLLWERLGKTHPQMFFLFTAIAPNNEIPPILRTHPDRLATKKALKMVYMIQTYMGGSRSAAHMKCTLKFLKEAKDSLISEDRLFESLQRHFSICDEPLWRMLRREWMDTRCIDKVENWQYEYLDFDKLQSDSKAMNESCQFEQIKIPYKHDPTERSRLRVRHGRITMELNGKLRNISIEYAPCMDELTLESEDGTNQINGMDISSTLHEGIQSTLTNNSTAQKWTRQIDAALLTGYNRSGGDKQKCIDIFMVSPLAGTMKRKEVENRLKSLVSMAKSLKKGQKINQKIARK